MTVCCMQGLTNTHTETHTDTQTHTDTNTHTHIHTHTHAHTCSYLQLTPSSQVHILQLYRQPVEVDKVTTKALEPI